MRVEQVTVHNKGCRLAGTLLLPDETGRPVPGIIQGPGWLGLRDAALYRPYHDALVAAGFAVLTLDYRGFGGSEGDATFLDPMDQVDDIRAGLTYLGSRSEVDTQRLGIFGSGGTGGGNAIVAAAIDERVKAVVSQVPVADGADWLHRMRTEHEWLDFRTRVAAAWQRYAATGEQELVSPRDGIMVPTPERRATSVKQDVDGRVSETVALHSAEAIMRYRPLDHVARIAPRAVMLVSVEHDAVTPEDHARSLYDAAGEPKCLLVQTQTTHYAAYAQYRDVINPRIVAWFQRFLVDGEVHVHEAVDQTGVRYLDRGPDASSEPTAAAMPPR